MSEDSGRGRASGDVFQRLADPAPAVVDMVVERLEQRGRSERFNSMRDTYLDAIGLRGSESVLDLGCGTGVVARALAARGDFDGPIRATDYSAPLVEAARGLAAAEGLQDRIVFAVGDASDLGESDNSFDVVILHTLISHVPDPAKVLSEVARVAKPGARVVIFDGDYASLALAADHPADVAMTEAILHTAVANPTVLRILPSLFAARGLGLDHVFADALVEIGSSAFFANMAKTYLPMAVDNGLVDSVTTHEWLACLDQAHAAGTSFGSCNYLSYITTATED